TKTGPASIVAGQNMTYTITWRNHGPLDAQNVMVTDAIPSSETILGANAPSGGGVVVNGNNVTFTLSTLAAGASATSTITVTANASDANGSVLHNTATITSNTPDTNSSNNNSSIDTTVVNNADLSVTKTGPASVIADQDLTYTITV